MVISSDREKFYQDGQVTRIGSLTIVRYDKTNENPASTR